MFKMRFSFFQSRSCDQVAFMVIFVHNANKLLMHCQGNSDVSSMHCRCRVSKPSKASGGTNFTCFFLAIRSTSLQMQMQRQRFVLNLINSLKFHIKSILFSVEHHHACPYSNKTAVDYSRIKKIMLKRQSVTSDKDVARKPNGVQLINRHRENQATALCERISTLSDQYDAGRCTTLNFGMLKKCCKVGWKTRIKLNMLKRTMLIAIQIPMVTWQIPMQMWIYNCAIINVKIQTVTWFFCLPFRLSTLFTSYFWKFKICDIYLLDVLIFVTIFCSIRSIFDKFVILWYEMFLASVVLILHAELI